MNKAELIALAAACLVVAPLSAQSISNKLNSATASVPSSVGRETAAPGVATQAGGPEYRIGPGDVLQIIVWKEADASVPAVVVRTDGKISLPLIQEVDAIGRTPQELSKALKERYARMIHDVDVTVLPKEINSQKVYLVGAVKREGAVRLQSAMTVLQVLAESGGLTDYAKRKRIYILRTDNQRQVRLPFDYNAVLRGEKIQQNINVWPGDTIVVPQ